MKTQTLTLISIAVSIAFSLTATLATYDITIPQETRFLHEVYVNRGWPLHWITESWSYWDPPPYPRYFTLQPTSFLIDLTFYAIIFQIPTQIYIYLRKARKKPEQQRLDTNTHTTNKPST